MLKTKIQTDIDDLKYWLILHYADDIGSATAKKLLSHFKSPQRIVEANRDSLMHWGLNEAAINSLKSPNIQQIEQECLWTKEFNQQIITFHDSNYPYLLKQISDPPLVLYVLGDQRTLNQPQVAVVGSRNPTVMGVETAKRLAFSLSKMGLAVTSGLAFGIDTAAHRGTLQANGKTIAVLGSGLNRIYPTINKLLADDIVKNGGALISEFPLETPPLASHFPKRNRIISGLSLGTLVVEAAERSGSLITARMAAEQGREVFAVPGSVHSPYSRGCHYLIRQGAKLVESAADILEELGPLAQVVLNPPDKNDPDPENSHSENAVFAKLDESQRRIFDCIGFEALSVDEITALSGLSPSEITSALVTLELEGFIQKTSGGRYIRFFSITT